MSKNVRISLYILIPIIGWVISGQFIEEEVIEKKSSQELTSVIIEKSDAECVYINIYTSFIIYVAFIQTLFCITCLR